MQILANLAFVLGRHLRLVLGKRPLQTDYEHSVDDNMTRKQLLNVHNETIQRRDFAYGFGGDRMARSTHDRGEPIVNCDWADLDPAEVLTHNLLLRSPDNEYIVMNYIPG
ncbi:hypothetical protein DXG01_007451 [Tephrocybe rancida]|nr:hypothetical protein DXG01_007451 [Tephrocybe rancida]